VPDPLAVAAAVLARLAERHPQLESGSSRALLDAWRARSVPWWGHTVEVVSGEQALRGTALDVDGGGALLLRLADGRTERVLAGEARELRLEEEKPAPETAYYQAVEEFFVSRRGDPLFLSNPDWLLIHEWRTAGVPLRVVLRGITDAFESHAHSWSRARKVGSLAYCRSEVEVARERWQRALALGEEEGVDAREQVSSVAQALLAATSAGSPWAGLAADIAAELGRLAAGPLPSSVERRLQERELELLKALRAAADPALLAQHDAAIERDLSPYKERMPAKVLEQIREEARTRRLFEAHGLPRLSLFAP
jgi:hypothetical protein